MEWINDLTSLIYIILVVCVVFIVYVVLNLLDSLKTLAQGILDKGEGIKWRARAYSRLVEAQIRDMEERRNYGDAGDYDRD